MKRFKKFYPAAVLMMAVVVVCGAAKANALTPPKAPTTAKVVCKLPATLKLSGTKFVLPAKTAGCWLVRSSTQKRLKVVTKVTQHFADLLGPIPTTGPPPVAVCSGLPTSNTAAAVKLFVNPIGRYRGSMWPGYSFGTLTISAKSGKLKGSVVRKWSKPNTTAQFFCGPPAKLAVHQAAYAMDQTPPAPTCVWDVYPKMNGLSASGGTVGCTVPSGESCRWIFQFFQAEGIYLGPDDVLRCVVNRVNYYFAIVFRIHYGPDNMATECYGEFAYWSGSIAGLPSWGQGYVRIGVGIDDLNAHLYPD